MSNTTTNTATYTVIDIRKTFEGFAADFRMIARRTEKKSIEEVEMYIHDILVWAEKKCLLYVDIVLLDTNDKPIKAARYTVNSDGKANQSDRAGNNDWPNVPNTRLMIIVLNNSEWNNLSEETKVEFKKTNGFKISWGPSKIDNSYSHLSKERAQLYASKGYELGKEDFK
jgi:hypothetical protein